MSLRQQGTYAGWVQKHGRAGADRISARPGHSEHQTGLAMEIGNASGICALQACMEGYQVVTIEERVSVST